VANLSIQQLTRAGIAGALAAAAGGGDTYDNTGEEWIEVENGHSSAQSVYAAIYTDGQTIAQGMTVSVPAGARRLIKPLPMKPYTNPADQRVHLTYSGVTLLTIGIFRP
jgi:hypothetical protein